MGKKVLVALGGNAILRPGETRSAETQLQNIRRVCRQLVEIVSDGHRIAITHGNGPQVGDIFLRNEMAKDTLPPMPLDVCVAESQGMLGYMLQQSMRAELTSRGLNTSVATILTQVLVDRDDPAFSNPTKPIGPFYPEREAAGLRQERGFELVYDISRGYRRVVPSPRPTSILEGEPIRELFLRGVIVIACGGGGVPVVAGNDGVVRGAEAVVDKDLTAALLATLIGAEVLLILTDVEKVSLNYRRPDQKDLDRMSLEEASRYLAEGHFPAGSMGPKIEAALEFLRRGGERVLITSTDRAVDAMRRGMGTTLTLG